MQILSSVDFSASPTVPTATTADNTTKAASTAFVKAQSYLTGVTLTGDVTGTGSSSVAATLANSGVSAGTYNGSATSVTPFTVDSKGRITGTGAAVTITPAWSSVTSRPTTVGGFGITDALTTADRGIANGVATLDATTKVPVAQIPDPHAAVQTIDTKTGAYNFVLGDVGKLIRMDSSVSANFTVPTNASHAIAVGASIDVVRWGTGAVEIVGASGVTIRATPTAKLRAQYSGATLRKVGTDEWWLVGDLASS